MSQQSISVLTLTVTASSAVTEGRAVGFDGAQASTQGQKIMGVAVTDAASGGVLAVVTHGTAIMESGAAISVGDSVMVDSDGKAIAVTGALGVASGATAVTSSAANGAILDGADLPEFALGDALQAAAGAGEFIEIMLRR